MTPEEAKQRSRGFSVDMSGEAIARRIDQVSRLRALGIALSKAKILPPDPPASDEVRPHKPIKKHPEPSPSNAP
jgi:hypothetical protein